MKNFKETLINIGAILFVIFIIVGWFQPDGHWWFIPQAYMWDDLIFNIIRKISEFIFGIFI